MEKNFNLEKGFFHTKTIDGFIVEIYALNYNVEFVVINIMNSVKMHGKFNFDEDYTEEEIMEILEEKFQILELKEKFYLKFRKFSKIELEEIPKDSLNNNIFELNILKQSINQIKEKLDICEKKIENFHENGGINKKN